MLTDSRSVSIFASTLEQIESGSIWKQVYQDLGIPVLNSAAGYNVKCAYRKYVHTMHPQLLKALKFYTNTDMHFVVVTPHTFLPAG